MSEIQFLDEGELSATAEVDSLRREVTFTVTLVAPTAGRIGPVIDQLEALALQAGLEIELTIPGYHRAFYGHEADVDDPAR